MSSSNRYRDEIESSLGVSSILRSATSVRQSQDIDFKWTLLGYASVPVRARWDHRFV
jgi:hypothetical protein